MSFTKSLRRNRGWFAAVALAAIAIIAWFMLRDSGVTDTAVSYQTDTAAHGTLSVTVSGTGNLEIDNTTDVYPAISGTVDDINVSEGEAVATGTVLFTLDPTDIEADSARAYASLLQAEQGVAQSESNLAKAQKSLDDLEEAYGDQVTASAVGSQAETPTDEATAPTDTGTAQQTDQVTQDDLDNADLEVASAQAALASAKASRTSAQLAYDQALSAEDGMSVTAPCSGIVYSLDIERGDSVSGDSAAGTTGTSTSGATGGTTGSSAPIVLAPEQPLAVHLTVNEVDLPTLAVDQRADIEFDALPDLTATGKIYEIGDEGLNEQGVVTFDVWLSVDVADSGLRSGMSAAATIVTDVEGDALLVPNAAVRSDSDGGYYVEVLAQTATADEAPLEPTQVPVTIGLSNATSTQILSGLSEGDVVVTQTVESADEEASGTGFMMPGMGAGRPQ